MDELERWKIEREVFRKWLVSKDWRQILDIADDVEGLLGYHADRIEKRLDKKSFVDFMEGQFPK